MSKFPCKYSALNLVAVAALATVAGCGESSSAGNGGVPPNTDVGSIGLALQLVPGVAVSSFSYTLSGPKTRRR